MRALAFVTLSLLGLGSAGSLAACGSDSSPEQPQADAALPTDDAAAAPDTSDAADAADAPPPPTERTPAPQVVWGGGALLRHPNVVTITFPDDPYKGTLEAFDDFIVTSDWWTAVTKEYCGAQGSTDCIGAGTSGGHVVMPSAAKTSYSLSEIDALVHDGIRDGTFPTPTADSLYAVFMPSGIAVADPGFVGCTDFDAYHQYVMVDAPAAEDGGVGDAGNDAGEAGADADAGSDAAPPQTRAAYALMMRCKDAKPAEVTLSASHEIVEAATDPFLDGYNVDDTAFASLFYTEVGDLCDFEPSTMAGQFTVQRVWSNASAAAGHDPCVPIPPGNVYFNASPEKRETPIVLKIGESITIDVHAFSDAPTAAGTWSLEAFDSEELYQRPPNLELSLDTKSVHDGSTARLTLKLLKMPEPSASNVDGVASYALVSTRSNTQYYWPGMVVPKR